MDIDLNEPTRPQLAALFGCSSRWIGELRSKGDLPADGASWAENLEAYVNIKVGRYDPDMLDLEAERARLAKEQADAKAMDNAERRKELASRTDMIAAGTGVIIMAVARLSQVGAQVAQGDTKLRKRIETAINDVLTDLSMTRIEEAVGGGLDDEDAPGDEDA
ncbi:terminase [Sphingobium sp.]|jgi:phage terminase Nu1 subunit (DNA packaging protein)|uniref:terminase n=1 Tax=Sphingobium sp. TaxID=1912891 RepID=UPI00261FFE15|nr:terminase [Sphingobium sp.]